ncbi:Cyclin-dependent kinase 1 [Apiospora hydei]|uniref:Cyclin-dependent kinase 1 n=1 Tax=Apiospora hydei TaxID=1337664 RepID=A0ABR1X4M1_9PEZI
MATPEAVSMRTFTAREAGVRLGVRPLDQGPVQDPLFDEADLPILGEHKKSAIGNLMRTFKVDHIDAAADGSNVEEFWPAKVLEKILSRDRIVRDLKRKRHMVPGIKTDQCLKGQLSSLADIVLGEYPGSQGEKYLKVMALLCLLEREKEIIEWIRSRVSDISFPLKSWNQQLYDRSGRLLTCVQHWRKAECEILVRNQWAITTPFFQLNRHGKPIHYNFPEPIILPWRKLTGEDHLSWQASNRAEGGYAIVQGVMMAKSSYDFDSVLSSLKFRPNGFALKKIKSSPPQDDLEGIQAAELKHELTKLYYYEVAILKQFSDSSQHHLIFLLNSFTLKQDLCFLFPHADCDLLAYWESIQREPLAKIEYKKWVSRQLCGITSAVRTLHAGSVTTEGERRYCRHGDIRPENILWFRSDTDKYGILVLSDMGVSTFNRTVSRSKKPAIYVAQIPGYHPPESVLAGGEVDRTFDVWSLGCVYLEMMAWALGGYQYLREFREARVFEPNTHVQSDIFYKIEIIDSMGAQVHMVKLKDSVVVVSTDTFIRCVSVKS